MLVPGSRNRGWTGVRPGGGILLLLRFRCAAVKLQTRPALFFFQLQLCFIFFEECTKILGLVQQPGPLFVIQGDGKSSQAIYADTAFFAYTKFECSGTASSGFFQFRQAGLQFFIRRFCHVAPLISLNSTIGRPFAKKAAPKSCFFARCWLPA